MAPRLYPPRAHVAPRSTTNEVIVVESEEEWKECCQFIIDAKLQKLLKIVVIPGEIDRCQAGCVCT